MALRSTPAERLKQWVGNLIIAWTVVASLAAILGAAYYQKTGNRAILLMVVGGAGAGCVLLVGFAGIIALWTRQGKRRGPTVKMVHQSRQAKMFMTKR